MAGQLHGVLDARGAEAAVGHHHRLAQPEQDRAALLAALACVDAVVLFDEDTPEALIAALRPDLIVKGGDYDMEALPETALVRSWGGDAVAIPFEFQRSTTALVKKLRD